LFVCLYQESLRCCLLFTPTLSLSLSLSLSLPLSRFYSLFLALVITWTEPHSAYYRRSLFLPASFALSLSLSLPPPYSLSPSISHSHVRTMYSASPSNFVSSLSLTHTFLTLCEHYVTASSNSSKHYSSSSLPCNFPKEL
jgi:hypothetical protein